MKLNNRDMKIITLVITSFLLLFVIIIPITPASAVAINFQPKIKMNSLSASSDAVASSGNNVYVIWGEGQLKLRRSVDNGISFSPAITLSDEKVAPPALFAIGSNVYVAWTGSDFSRGVTFRASNDYGATFGPPITLVKDQVFIQGPRIAAVGSNVYVVWTYSTGVFFARSIDNGATFDAAITINDDGISADDPHIAAAGNNVYVSWENNGSTGPIENDDIFFARSTDNGANFGPKTEINTIDGTGGHDLAAVGDNVYLIWMTVIMNEDNTGGYDLFFTRSIDGGANFEPERNLSNTIWSSMSAPKIAASGSGVYIMWDESGMTSDLYFFGSTDNGLSFSSLNLTQEVSSQMINGDMNIVASGNDVYAVWLHTDLGTSDNDIYFRHSPDRGQNFDSIINVSNSSPPQHPAAPFLSTSAGNVYVMWSELTGLGNTDVFFSTSASADSTLYCGRTIGQYDSVIYGTNGRDTLTGTAGNDLMFGYAGNDRINGLAGDDCIYAGSGNDRVNGGPGNDVIYGEDGNDILRGYAGNDQLYGGSGNDRIDGHGGNDNIDGGEGTNTCNGGRGTNTIVNCT